MDFVKNLASIAAHQLLKEKGCFSPSFKKLILPSRKKSAPMAKMSSVPKPHNAPLKLLPLEVFVAACSCDMAATLMPTVNSVQRIIFTDSLFLIQSGLF